MASPINVNDILTFGQIGIDLQFATISNTALSRDRYLCVRENTETEQNVAIVDLMGGNSLNRFKMKADAAVMHPSKNIIALRGNNTLQVFDLSTRTKLKNFQIPDGQVVSYWRWIDDDVIAFVAGSGVFHWSLSANSNPVMIFQMLPQIASCNVMSYSVSHDMNWFALFGLMRENDQMVGKVQLFCREKNTSQTLDAYCAAFSQYQGIPLLIYSSKANGQIRLNVIPLAPSNFGKKFADLQTPPDVQDDLPLQLVVSPKYSTAFLLTRSGLLYLMEIENAFVYVSVRVSQAPFLHASLAADNSILTLTREGRLIKIAINDSSIVDFVSTKKSNPQVASKIASSAGIQMSGEFVSAQFDQLLFANNFQEAARIAAQINTDSIRGQQTIAKLQRLPSTGGAPPVVQYLGSLIQITKLREFESVEFCRQVINLGKGNMIENWIKEDKLTPTEELGDLIKPHDTRIATAIYVRANASAKSVAAFAEMGAFDKLVQYCQKMSYTPNWLQIITIVSRSSADKIDPLLTHVANQGQPLADPRQVVQILIQYQLWKQATSFLIDVITGNKEEDSDLQTMVFEIALTNIPKVAEELFSSECFTFYDRQKIAGLCERAGNFQRALEHYTDLPSIKRCIVNTQSIAPDFLIQYFSTMSPEWALECLKELLVNNPKANIQVSVRIAGTYYNQLGIDSILNLFNQARASEAIYYFLAQVVTTCTDPDIHFRYIEAAARIQDYNEVERMCRDSQYLQPERVRDFLIQADLPDRIPIIVLCDRFAFIEDLTRFLYKKGATREIENFVQKFNPSMAGRVIGALIDIEAQSSYITNLIDSIQHLAPMEDLIRETMKREKLSLIQGILEQRASSGSTDPAINNGIVLLAYNLGRNPERILRENKYYDPLFVGDILSKRDSHLACISYAKGNCDEKLIELTNQHQLYKEQARYLVKRQDPGLWSVVLNPENVHMKLVTDAVISTAIPECDDPERVKTTVKAFSEADIPIQLLSLLERVVFESPQFQNNVSLQNLIIITSARFDTSRVMNYITRLNDYAWEKIALKLIEEGLFDEAIACYKKFNKNVEAVNVMLNYQQNLGGAADWASHCNDPLVWGAVARVQIQNGMVSEAIDSFIKGKDSKEYLTVIEAAKSQEKYKALVPYLQMTRQIQNRDPIIESELCFAFAKCDMLSDLEELVSSPSTARTKEIADRCYSQKLFKAAKILYSSVKDYAMLAETLIEIKEFQAAIDAARKVSSPKTWKAVNAACIKEGDFKLAQVAGLQIVMEADQLAEVINLYERLGYFQQIIQLLESAMTLERAHGGIFTELAVLYSKYQPEKCHDHLKQFFSRIALFKVIQTLQKLHMWKELTFAYDKYSEFDNAVSTIMEHPSVAWTHPYFKELISQVSNADILYRSLNFYLRISPMDIPDLLSIVGPKIDASRIVDTFKRSNNLQLIKSYLASIQSANVKSVNESLNQMYIEDGDFDSLRRSIDTYSLFDHIMLAKQLESHQCIEFRRIAAYIYRQGERWNEAIELSKKDSLFRDAIESASQSKSPEIAEGLLRFFVDNDLFECFAATTFVCYDLLGSDVVLELAWRKQCIDFAMPYIIQTMKEQNQTIAKLQSDVEALQQSIEETKKVAQLSAAQATFPTTAMGFPDDNQPPFPTEAFPGNAPRSADPFGNAPFGNNDPFANNNNAFGGSFAGFPPTNAFN